MESAVVAGGTGGFDGGLAAFGSDCGWEWVAAAEDCGVLGGDVAGDATLAATSRSSAGEGRGEEIGCRLREGDGVGAESDGVPFEWGVPAPSLEVSSSLLALLESCLAS